MAKGVQVGATANCAYSKKIAIQLTDTQFAVLNAFAQYSGISFSEVVRRQIFGTRKALTDEDFRVLNLYYLQLFQSEVEAERLTPTKE